MNLLSILILLVLSLASAYPAVFALALFKNRIKTEVNDKQNPSHRFCLVLPAHDEANVIGSTVKRLRDINYPAENFQIHIIADHCSDDTAEISRQAGAIVHERDEGPRTGKGAALAWGLKRILTSEDIDALVIFDADTQVDPEFLHVMDIRLSHGEQVIQGQHVISNPSEGWLPGLIWAMFLIDNIFQNQGRANIGWSAKNMGDSICLRADILRQMGWGEGLTEDYQFRQRLLLNDICIAYEQSAIGYGEAPANLKQARPQRLRWIRGTQTANQQFARELLKKAWQNKSWMLLDGALQAYMPSYSTLTLFSMFGFVLQIISNYFAGSIFAWNTITAWGILTLLLFIYPFLGLAFAKAPVRAYYCILTGPFFIFWRTGLAILNRLGNKNLPWVRTEHHAPTTKTNE